MSFSLVSPFPPGELPLAWAWLHEFPANNFDDYGPTTYAEFAEEMERRGGAEQTWGIMAAGHLCGIVAYLPYTPRSGTFHGVCFTRSVHGTGIPRAAVRAIADEIFASGVEKISASFFASNLKVHRFLAGLGAVDEGLMRQHTLQGGIPIDMRLVALFKGPSCHSAECS